MENIVIIVSSQFYVVGILEVRIILNVFLIVYYFAYYIQYTIVLVSNLSRTELFRMV